MGLSSKKILVTGASGFVGLHLLSKLDNDHFEVIGIHHQSISSGIRSRFSDAVSWFQANIVHDDLDEIMAGVSVVFHLAAYSTISESEEDKIKMEQVNIIGTKRVAEAAKRAGVNHFVFISSVAACEESVKSIIDEENGYPVSAYGKSKHAAEMVLKELMTSDFNVTVFRPTSLFGEDHLGSIFELVKAIREKKFVIIGDGNYQTNFYYIEDFIFVLLSVIGNHRAYGHVFIAADKPYTIKQLADSIVDALKEKIYILKVPLFIGLLMGLLCELIAFLTKIHLPLSRKRVRAMTSNITYSNLKLETVLNINPAYGVDRGLRRTVKWYQRCGYL